MIYEKRLFGQSIKPSVAYLFLTSFIFIIQGCKLYDATEINPGSISSTHQITDNLDVYKIYVHTETNSFELEGSSIDEDGSVTGIPKIVNYEQPDSSWGLRDKKTYWENHKYDINYYCKADLEEKSLQATNSEELILIENERVTVHPNEMQKVTITSINREKEVTGAALVALIVVGVVVGVFLIVLLTALVAKASSDGANASSDESSGNSGSGGGSSSSGGDGSSGNGGSSSGSGGGSGSSG